ncbi:MAG: hypothetical protein E7122_03000 [Bacteroidales bacterium]|nr:hypothetical protein [Bacteroidales bacterium]
MNNQFLREVAGCFVSDNRLDCTFVLPNRRSVKFFQRYFGQEYGSRWGTPLFSPEIITINDFVQQLSGLEPADPVEQLYLLYKEYVAIKSGGIGNAAPESFDDFVHWGNVILKDFNDIDKYMVNPRQLFTNIRELKELETDFSFLSSRQLEAVKCFWSNYLKGGTFTQKKEFFASIWGIMYTLYENFNKTLIGRGIGYEGQIYRRVAEKIDGKEFSKDVVFIGFNAPNVCEKRIMRYLRDCGKGDFYWDFYGEMLTDPLNGAYGIISGCVKEFPSKYRIKGDTVPKGEQKISVFASPSGIGQAFVVAEILEKLFPGEEVGADDAFSTAVVLPDENMLMPVLNSIPPKFKSINVTMGYPLSAAPLASFMNLVRQMQSDVRIWKGEKVFYHASLLELLSHEYVKRLAKEEGARIRRQIVEGNMIYIPVGAALLEGENVLLSRLFHAVDGADDILGYLMDMLEYLDSALEGWDREFVYRYYQQVNRLRKLEIPMEGATCFRLLEQLCRGIVVPFRGEPLAGLQVMGTLETRALDFDNVIIVSANEGKFPQSSVADSIVPYNLRVGFGLPTYELQDGIAAYHFYRSICRARNVYMIYDTRTEGLSVGEVSRYVKQLKYHFQMPLQETVVSVPPVINGQAGPVKVEKRGEVMEKLVGMFTGEGTKSLSASALNNYIACPLKFYVESVEGMADEEEVAESVESNVFGSIFHFVMEGLYKEYEGGIVGKEVIAGMMKDSARIGELILKGFEEHMHLKELEGQHRIVEALLRKYISLALAEDMLVAPFRYVAGERRFRYVLPVYGGKLGVNFKAFIDRIDILSQDNITRIVDYKTGAVTAPDSKFELPVLFDKDGDGRYKAITQLYLYALIYFKDELERGETVKDALLTIYPLKKIAKEHPMQLLLEHDSLMEFKELLVNCVEEIFNEDVPFYANPQEKHCGYCKLQALCQR